MRIDREFIKEIGIYVYITYALVTVFCYAAYQLFNVAQIPPFLGSHENLWFVLAWGVLLSLFGRKRKPRNRLYMVSLICGFIIGILTLAGGLLLLNRGSTIAYLPITASILLILQQTRQLYLRHRK